LWRYRGPILDGWRSLTAAKHPRANISQTSYSWEIPRSDYPMTRPGYLTWRAKLKAQAAVQVSELISAPATELTSEQVERIAALIRKEGLGKGAGATGEASEEDDDVQVLEDVACLVFLDDQFDDFERRVTTEHNFDEAKMLRILRKTWGKMSPRGRELALGMDLSEKAKGLIGKALEGT
jgi:hypothetical protein